MGVFELPSYNLVTLVGSPNVPFYAALIQ